MSIITEEVQSQSEGQGSAPGPSSKRGSGSRRKRDSALFRFHGVRKRSWGRYVSEIRLPGQKTRIWLGSFGSPEMAARAYDCAAFFLKGNSATLNFPDLVDSLPRPLSSSRRDIQSAASKAALQLLHQPKTEDDSSNSMEQQEEDSIWTTSFDAPLMSPLRVDSTFGDLTWSEVFNFNDDILMHLASTSTLL
ncbi:DNA-binding domain superfamily [Sesbania bispinosa]|nr:DNA-binding domain superfamily [Sesbania bispinosa]